MRIDQRDGPGGPADLISTDREPEQRLGDLDRYTHEATDYFEQVRQALVVPAVADPLPIDGSDESPEG